MGKYFRGWKRKVGVVTLLVACVATGWWVRSVLFPGDIKGSKAGERKELVPGIAFRWCPAGTFTMGEDHDKVDVELTKGFWMSETEVTQGQWEKFMRTTPWPTTSAFVKVGANYPACYISYGEAVDFSDILTQPVRGARRLPAGWKFALPTEAQWEYACRAETKTKYSFGNNEAQFVDYGWSTRNATFAGELYAHQVGLKKGNAWGLKDMHGNVWEWCSDWYEEKLPGGTDPVGASSGSFRVRRGGCWSSIPLDCRTAIRFMSEPGRPVLSLGFRVVAVSE